MSRKHQIRLGVAYAREHVGSVIDENIEQLFVAQPVGSLLYLLCLRIVNRLTVAVLNADYAYFSSFSSIVSALFASTFAPASDNSEKICFLASFPFDAS